MQLQDIYTIYTGKVYLTVSLRSSHHSDFFLAYLLTSHQQEKYYIHSATARRLAGAAQLLA